jgi:Protein of unknown function (DUF3293)
MNELKATNELIDAYRNTDFIIEAPRGKLIMRCGENEAAIDDLLSSLGGSESAFITAHNPGSEMLPDIENAHRHQMLLCEVRRMGCPHLPGRGVGRDGNWEPEESLFIVSISRTQAQKLGHAFGQIAIVVKMLGYPAELVLCS